MSGQLVPVKFPKDALSFFVGISKLAARARARGDLDAVGDPIWSVNEWRAFCRGVREYGHIRALGIGMAAYRTAIEVEEMLKDQFDAESIHAVLKGYDIQRRIEENKRTQQWQTA